MARRPPRLAPRLAALTALLLSLALSLGSVAAAAPTVTANPALVPFSPVPGQPGTTTLTFDAGGTTGLTACGQDNANLPTFAIGAIDPTTPLVVNFPFIQAGKYTFWMSADSTCAGAKFAVAGVAVQATATRLGPTGKAGADDIAFLSNPTVRDLSISPAQAFPFPGEQLCIMSGDGAQVSVALKVGQDPRLYGTISQDTIVNPIAGQNGCYAIPWVVNGYYNGSIARSPAVAATLGFCSGANKPDASVITSPPPDPIGTPQVPGGGAYHCAQITYQLTTNGVAKALGPTDNFNNAAPGSVLTGAAITGGDNHAIQTCFYLAVPAQTPGGSGGTIFLFGSNAQSFNGSGAMDLTTLPFTNFPPGSRAFLDTYDVNNPNTKGGVGAAVKTCPLATATFGGAGSGGVAAFQLVDPGHIPNLDLLDRRFFSAP